MLFIRLAALFCLSFSAASYGAEPRFLLDGELNTSAVSSLVPVWNWDAWQKVIGLPENLRLSTAQNYLVKESQLKDFPPALVKELTAPPFLPAPTLERAVWNTILARWRALPIARKIPVLKISQFNSVDQARAQSGRTFHCG